MAGSNNADIRRGARATLRTNNGLLAIVPRASVFSQKVPANPTFPHVRIGSASSVALRAACVDGSDTIVAVHGFATPRVNGSKAIVEEAEDHADRIGAAIAAALDGEVVDTPRGKLKFKWTGEQLLQDPDEADCFHTIQNFRVRAITA